MTTIDIKTDRKGRRLFYFNQRIIERFDAPNPSEIDPKFHQKLISTYDFIKTRLANFNNVTQHNALACFAGNMVAHYLIEEWCYEPYQPPVNLVIAIQLGSSAYPSIKVSEYYGLPGFTRNAIAYLLNECVNVGLVAIVQKGYRNEGYHTGYATIIKPTKLLTDHIIDIHPYVTFDEVKPNRLVEIRDEDKVLVKPRAGSLAELARLNKNVTKINRSYEQYRFEVSTRNYRNTTVGKKYNYYSYSLPYGVRSTDSPVNIDIYGDLSLKRIFNNGTLKSGGRFTCQFHNMPGAERRNIIIDGVPTIELDYSNHHSRILYHTNLKQDYPGDIYDIGLTSGHASANDIRKLVKQAFLIIFNCGSWQSFYQAYAHELQSANPAIALPPDVTAKSIVAALKATHPNLATYFCKDKSYELMNLDSKIAEDVLLEFVKLGKPCLGIHDSFIVKLEDEDLLRQVMKTSYQKILKTSFLPRIT